MLTSTPRNRTEATGTPGTPTGRIGRTITPRRGLPSTRAVVGGLLVAVAAVGTWATVISAGAGAPPRYVVSARAIGPGQQIETGDLTWATVDLPPDQRARAFTDAEAIVGSIALGPMTPGEIIQVGSVTTDRPDEGQRELSFTVDAAWAVGGRLRPGDTIDVFATDDGVDGRTSTKVLSRATIRRIDTAAGDGFGQTDQQVLTVGIGDEATALITAARNGDLTVVRANGRDALTTSDTGRSSADSSPASAPSTTRDSGPESGGGG